MENERIPHGSDLTDADIAHMLGWKPAVFTCKDGTLSAVIRKIADEAARRERAACAQACRDAAKMIGKACIIGEDRCDAGLNVCENLAKKIEARGLA